MSCSTSWLPRLATCLALGHALGLGHAAAQPLTRNDFTIDLVTGPVLASGRITGLGGAYTALADGIDGAAWNPAAYGSRTLWELDWFEWELTAGVLFPGSFANNDFFNTGSTDGFRFKNFVFLTGGFRLQFGDTGIGFIPRWQIFSLVDAATGSTVNATFTTGHFGMAWQLFDGQIVLGAGGRLANLDLADGTGQELVSFSGTGLEGGLVVRLAEQPWRLGVAARFPVDSIAVRGRGVTQDAAGVFRAGSFVLPRKVYMPWEVQAGLAVQIGNRPLNRRWVSPDVDEQRIRGSLTTARIERERAQVLAELAGQGQAPPGPDPYRWLPRRARSQAFHADAQARRPSEEQRIDREIEAAEHAREEELERLTRLYVLLTADVLVTGPTEGGVGIEGFLNQQRARSGQRTTVSVRLGAEAEPWASRMKLRVGTYLEPSRFDQSGYRLHGTGGFDLRLFAWNLFGLLDEFDVRVGMSVDVAPRYFDWGFGVGFWH